MGEWVGIVEKERGTHEREGFYRWSALVEMVFALCK